MRRLRKILLIPLLLSCVYLVAIAFDETVRDTFNTFPLVYAPLAIALLLPGCLFTAVVLSSARRPELWRAAWLSICAVAPLAVFYPWVIIPGSPGLATGDFLFFLGWLTRYPNLGPINTEVLFGICCVILASFLPAFFAYFSIGGRPRKGAILGILLIETTAMVPLFLNLDFPLLLFGVSGYVWLDGAADMHNLLLAVGPLLRLFALAIATFTALRPFWQAKRSSSL